MTAQASTDPARVIRSPEYLKGTDIELFAPVYRACANKGISGIVVDDMEVWQVAAALGVDMGEDQENSSASGNTIAARRARALRAKGVI